MLDGLCLCQQTGDSLTARRTLAAGAAALALALSGCAAGVGEGEDSSPAKGEPTSKAPKVSAAVITSSIAPGASGVPIERGLSINATKGLLTSVRVTSAEGKLSGRLGPKQAIWTSSGRLQPGQTYKVRAVARDAKGLDKVFTSRFTTVDLTLDQQTYPSFVPLNGSEVGVGMPAIIRFDVPVSDKATIEKHLKVTTEPAQEGAFHWLSDNEVHWRPATYWQPGTKVTVTADVDSVPAGNGIYGQESRTNTFTIGRSMISKVDMVNHTMKVFRDGQLVRTIPITTGEQPKFTTRSGTKVIMEKFRKRRMNSETVGIPVDSDDGYDLDNVEYAMRVTYSGEFIHAAPWSVGSQGRANVSHGCTGMSTENAGWLYNNTIIGDVVEYTGTSRGMTLDNGYGDWNLDFPTYRSGSALL